MYKFLETFNLPRLNQKDNLNRLITSSEIEFVIKKNSQQKKAKFYSLTVTCNKIELIFSNYSKKLKRTDTPKFIL